VRSQGVNKKVGDSFIDIVLLMAPMLELLLVFLCAGTTTSEVNDNFNNCKQDFFYQGTPPAVSYPGELREKSICQKYNNVYHFATLYSIRYRIPIYSAYRLPLGNCQGEQPKRRDNWFIEPQVGNYEFLSFCNHLGLRTG